jgi:hypothetical protein
MVSNTKYMGYFFFLLRIVQSTYGLLLEVKVEGDLCAQIFNNATGLYSEEAPAEVEAAWSR